MVETEWLTITELLRYRSCRKSAMGSKGQSQLHANCLHQCLDAFKMMEGASVQMMNA